jgi:putative nucleotidyltransferase with HDIG domain
MTAVSVDKSLLKSLLIMGSVVEARDAYTGGHLWRVSQYAKLLGIKIGLDNSDLIRVSLAGYLHDLGKVGVSDAILNKRDQLSLQEFDVIKTHPVIGAEIIRDHPLSELVVDAIRHHHERINGKGYPDGLAEDEISLFARIVALVDAFDALTSTRSYHQAISATDAIAILERERGTHFDDMLMKNFIALEQESAFQYILMHSDEMVPLMNCPSCGPVIVVSRDAKDGDSVYCQVCKSELRLHKHDEHFALEKTGAMADAEHLRPEADLGPIDDLVKKIPKTIRM